MRRHGRKEIMRVSLDLRFVADCGMGCATYQRALWEGLEELAADGCEWIGFGQPKPARAGLVGPLLVSARR